MFSEAAEYFATNGRPQVAEIDNLSSCENSNVGTDCNSTMACGNLIMYSLAYGLPTAHKRVALNESENVPLSYVEYPRVERPPEPEVFATNDRLK